MAQFTNADITTRTGVFIEGRRLVGEVFDKQATARSLLRGVQDLLCETRDNTLLHNFLVTSVMLAMGDGSTLEASALEKSLSENWATVVSLPYSANPCQVFMSDARQLPLPDSSVDLVVTSPPYINVFNYHQNYRKAMELMGWQLLDIAPSEIGANRKESIQNKGGGSEEGLSVLGSGYTSHKHPPGRS